MKKEIKLYMACTVLVLAMLAVIFLPGGKKANAQEVPINAETFPEEWLRNLLLTPEYDLDGNGILSDEEIQKIRRINYEVSEDTGKIEDITTEGLKMLPYCLVLSFYNIRSDKIKITAFSQKENMGVHFWNCQMRTLTLEGNIEYVRFPGILEEIEEYGRTLSSVDVLNAGKCPELEKIYCDGCKLRSLDVSKSKKLSYLSCYRCKLKKLNVKNNKQLEVLICDENNLKKLDLSHNKKLRELRCGDNNLSKLNLSHNRKLDYLECYNNNLKYLDLSKNINLRWVSCWDNSISTLCLPNSALIHGEANHEGHGLEFVDDPEPDLINLYSNFAGNPIHTLNIVKVKKFQRFTKADLLKFMSGSYRRPRASGENTYWGVYYNAKKRPIKRLVINKNMRKKDKRWIQQQAKKYKVKLIYR